MLRGCPRCARPCEDHPRRRLRQDVPPRGPCSPRNGLGAGRPRQGAAMARRSSRLAGPSKKAKGPPLRNVFSFRSHHKRTQRRRLPPSALPEWSNEPHESKISQSTFYAKATGKVYPVHGVRLRPPKILRRCRRANMSPGSSAGNCSPARRRARPGTSWPSASWKATTRAGNSGMTFG